MKNKTILEGRLRNLTNYKYSHNQRHIDIPREFWLTNFEIEKNGVVILECDFKPVKFGSIDVCMDFINKIQEVSARNSTENIRKILGVKKSTGLVKKSPNPTSDHKWEPQTLPDRSRQYHFKIDQNVLSKLKDVALSNIEKLQEDKGKEYISQAQEINQQIRTVVELAKTEIELVKTINQTNV